MKNVVTIALETPSLSTLVKLLKAADLVTTVQNLENATVFAPTNEAFANVPSDILEDLLQPANKHQLRKILLTHVVDHNIRSIDIMNADSTYSLSGALLEFHLFKGAVFVISPMSTAKVIKADIRAEKDVVVHVINQVLMP
jgi:uncharacterized surface protein with fasciclin (FAS1) repeats